MNKKFLSAILFGALMVTSTGTFVSCKDYDENIENLQGQISNLATKSDVEAKLNQLQSAIDAAKAEAVDAADLAALEAKVTSMQATIQAAVEADIAGYKAEIEALIKEVEAVVGEIADFVTSVELNYSNAKEQVLVLNFKTLTEKDNVFEDGLTGALTFEEGKQTITGESPIVVRVSPTNAVLVPEMISLVNSKGENLDEYVEFKVEKYAELLTTTTRGASNNGLWKITPVLKEENKVDDVLKKLKYVDGKGEKKDEILYAIQINNALETAEARYATSTYDITFGKSEPFVGENVLTFKVDAKEVDNLNNRFTYVNNESLKNFTATVKPEMYKELVWAGAAATAPIMETKGDVKKNVADATENQDNRADKELFLAVQGKKFTISISDYSEKNPYAAKIAGLYVTLDKKANAVESAPSEWNAWESYNYTGLNTVVAGTSIDVTIDSEETINDIIGFRVYAVNLDGTLVDPDGRAFYALVGEQAAETQTVTGTLTPKTDVEVVNYTVESKLSDAQSAVITKYATAKNTTISIVMDNKNNPLISDKAADAVAYTAEVIVEKDKAVKVKFTVPVASMKNMINDKTYKAVMTYKDETGFVLGEINLELTKTMPTEFPEDFAFRPKQETTEGSGKFIAYMMSSVNSYAVADAYATLGYKDLNNVFYGLDEYYDFQFATSKKDKDGKYTETKAFVDATKNGKAEYMLIVDKALIDNATPHAVTVSYVYPGISTYAYTKEDGTVDYKKGENHKVAYDKALEATYACWEDASAFTWGETNVNNVAVSTKPVLQWTADGAQREANLADIVSTNSYNNDFFGQDLNELINVSNLLKIATKDADDKAITTIKLTVGEQVNPYYVPTIEGSKIIFKQAETQVDAAPTADHEETLTITLVDAFGHQVTMSLPVTVKAPEKK